MVGSGALRRIMTSLEALGMCLLSTHLNHDTLSPTGVKPLSTALVVTHLGLAAGMAIAWPKQSALRWDAI